MITTYQALLAVAGRLPVLEENETTEDYLKRLILAVSGVPVPTFEAMPEDAQDYFNLACDALSAGTPMPLPDGFDREAILYPPDPPPPVRIARPNGSAYVAQIGRAHV